MQGLWRYRMVCRIEDEILVVLVRFEARERRWFECKPKPFEGIQRV